MNQPCGCCAGVEIATPVREANRPGLSALTYRVGTHATFFESMLARLTGPLPLRRLTTRAPDDPSIAWLDAWATVADVLTFYQERIANEGYLRTATERRSVLELAALVGYRLRPGVAASVPLAFTVADGFRGDLPAGTRAQSIPGAGEQPQFFETSEALVTRDVWNTLKPRLTRPQLTLESDPGTLYFQGITTNVKPGDALVIVPGAGVTAQLCFARTVEVQADANRTRVVVRGEPSTFQVNLEAILDRYVKEASSIFGESRLAREVASIVGGLRDSIASGATNAEITGLLGIVVPQVQAKHAMALRRGLTRLEPWIASLLDDLPAAPTLLPGVTGGFTVSTGPVLAQPSSAVVASSLADLGALVGSLALPPSLPPSGSASLARTATRTFASRGAVVPQILGAFHPVAAPLLYAAWANVVTPSTQVDVYAARFTAGLFASTYPGAATFHQGDGTTSYAPPTLNNAWGTLMIGTVGPSAVALDAVYDQIKPGSWVVIDCPGLDPTTHRVVSAVAVPMATGSFGAKVTQLRLIPSWSVDTVARDSTDLLRGTIVHALTERLLLAEKPIDGDIEGDAIELDRIYDGLESGRSIIVVGQRTDIPGVSGVTGAELAMVSEVSHGAGKSGLGAPGALRTTLGLANDLAYSYAAGTVTIYANVVGATHGQTVVEVLGTGDGSQAFQRFTLHQAPLTYVSAPTAAGAESTLVVRVNDVQWPESESLAGLAPADRSFLTQTDDADRTSVIFGDGRYGARPPTGTANVKAVYRYGIGAAGNVTENRISQLAMRPLGAKEVINPLPATGGADRDSRDRARLNAPLAVMALDRLVSTVDYADFARTFAGIGKAAAVRLSDGRRRVVHLTIAGVGDAPIALTSDLYRNLRRALHRLGDPDQPVQVALRRSKFLVVSAGVRVQPDYQWQAVEPKIRAALVEALGADRRDLGQSAFSSEVVSTIQAVAGVAYVDLRIFDAVPESITVDKLSALAGSLALNPHVEAELAHVDLAATDPARRILPAELVMLRPDIPDTLILTEISG